MKIKLIVFLLSVLFVISNGATAFAEEMVTADNENVEMNYGFSTKIKDTSFSEDRIIVIMKHEYSGINKVFTAEDFPELRVESIEDISGVPEGVTEEDYPNWEEFRQILSIKLVDKNKNDVKNAIKKLEKRADKDIYFAQPNYSYVIENSTVNDSYTKYAQNQEAYYDLIDLPQAWQITSGSSDVKVAVVDSIPYEHEDFNNNLNDYVVVHVNPTSTEAGEHGTFCSSILGMNGEFSGICKEVSIIPIYYGNYWDEEFMPKLVSYLNNNDIRIASCSWTMAYYDEGEAISNYSSVTRQAILNYRGLLFCSAGNKSVDIDAFPKYPACYDCPNIITVGATDNNDEVASFSNVGNNNVDLFAPGSQLVGIKSIDNQWTYGTDGGTSYATPMVAGVCALIQSVNPTIDPMEMKALILNNTDKVSALTGKCVTGGRLNAYKAVYAASQYVGNGFTFDTETKTLTGCYGDVENLALPSMILGVNVEKIGHSAFVNNKSLKRVRLPSTLKEIEANSFYGCTGLEEVVNTSTVLENIGSYAFYGCTNLKSISLPNTEITFGQGAFQYCYDLVMYGQGTGTIYQYAVDNNIAYVESESGSLKGYYQNNGSTELYIPSKINGYNSTLASKSFNGSAITRVVIPQSMTTIPRKAFYNCASLQQIEIPSTVTTMFSNSLDYCSNAIIGVLDGSYSAEIVCGNSDFSYCLYDDTGKVLECIVSTDYRGTKYVIPEEFYGTDMVSIESYCFADNFYTKSIIIPEGITTIGAFAFGSCSELQKIDIPGTVTSIGARAFRYCTSLKTIIIPESVTSITNTDSYSIFEAAPNVVVFCERGSYAETYATNNSVACVTLWDTEATECYVLKYYQNNGATDVEIPERFDGKKVTVILGNAFLSSNVTSVEIPKTIERIESGAFKGCILLSSCTILGYSYTTPVIEEGAIEATPMLTIYVQSDYSPAYQYAESNNISVVII